MNVSGTCLSNADDVTDADIVRRFGTRKKDGSGRRSVRIVKFCRPAKCECRRAIFLTRRTRTRRINVQHLHRSYTAT